MDDMKSKTVAESLTQQIQIIMPEHINGYNRLFGGKLVEWIDIVAAVVARRHSNREVTTVSIENLQFRSPAHVNNTILIIGRITYVGTTSMEVRVDTFVERLDGDRTLVNRAYLVMVALDESERPTKIPGLILQTDEDKAEWEAGLKRSALRKQRRVDGY